MIRIEVADTNVIRREIASKRTGEVFTVYGQAGYLDKGDKYPVRFEIPLDRKNPAPYPVGMYTFDASSFRLNQFGSLELDRYNVKLNRIPPVVLQALKNEASKAA